MAARAVRSQAATGTGSPETVTTAAADSRSNTPVRDKPDSASSARPLAKRPTIDSASRCGPNPFQAIPAASRCSARVRAYAGAPAWRMAMSRAATPSARSCITARTTHRTSSSMSETLTIRLPTGGATPAGGAGTSTPSRPHSAATGLSADGSPVVPTTTWTRTCSASALTRAASDASRRSGRWTTTVPSAAT
ncbi:MAG TPA: hypothetical protein DEP69_02160, partial [Acidimicrobiaceae bacterium]|nr:hypothetical protein [Acidimicrobiaceae bacterium]